MEKYLVLVAATLLCACSSTSIESREQGGYQIQCVDSVTDCHDQARSTCPGGYLVTNRVRPVKVDGGGNTRYTLNIKCRNSGFQ